MIIECKECGRKYKFDESQIEGEGIWVRCANCKAVFFEENPVMVEIAKLMAVMRPGGDAHESVFEDKPSEEKSYVEEAEDADQMFVEVEPENDTQFLNDDEIYNDIDRITGDAEVSEKEDVQKTRLPGKIIALCIILIILLSAGIFLWTSPQPQVTKMTLGKILPPMEKLIEALPKVGEIVGTKDEDIPNESLARMGVDLLNVKERFAKNWVAGDIMVIEGTVVNNNEYAVSHMRVIGKILDSSGNIIAEEESICGNILTDVELKSLTEEEIIQELSNPYGRDFSVAVVEPGKDIPFMLALVMPSGEASEFLVELVGIEAANN
ncbi:MAG: DUF3426 domain-containing protein [Thermodesulfobacteriota bacterium]|nr:DUF3426 domain-containing protein [Thermodesulfobacteriota bacterium]